MELKYAFCARFAETTPDGTISMIGGGFNVLSGPTLPVLVPMLSVVARFEFTAEECGRAHEVSTSFIGPNGEPLREPMVLAITPTARESNQDIPSAATCVLSLVGASFDHAGDYAFRFSIGGRFLRSVSVRIHAATQP